ncbi:MAG: hypothetical protein GX814_07420 [Microbacteriaceae bacterium]|jgi:Ca2+/Na+ antiporter|nr:hypothetical protein [Microbacteriaceae bacterium]
MDILRIVLLVLHIIGAVGILVGVITQLPKVKSGLAKINGAIMHSSWLMLVTGLALVGTMYMRDLEPNNAKIGIKTLILIAIIVLALVNKKKERVGALVLSSIGVLTVANVLIATLWK